MIWKHWPVGELQKEIGSDVFDRMDQILPAIDPEDSAFFYQTKRDDLVKLLAAFADERYFEDKANVSKCLNYLSPEDARRLSEAIGIDIQLDNEKSLSDAAAKISRQKAIRIKFLQFFELSARFYPSPSEKSPAMVTVHAPTQDYPVSVVSPYKVLKDYQYDVYYRAKNQLKPPLSRTIIQMPTGSGKTRTAMELIAQSLLGGQSQVVFWLANSEELCEQSVACFVDVWSHVGNKDVQVHRLWGSRAKPSPSDLEDSDHFVVASFQSLWAAIKKSDEKIDQILSRANLLVVDEAHIAVADTYSQVVRKICSLSGCRAIGLTATPGRTIEEENSQLSDLFFGEILSLRDPTNKWDNAIAYLRSVGVMANVTYEPLVTQGEVKLSNKELLSLNQDLDFPAAVLKRIGNSNLRSAEIVARLRNYLKGGAQTLLFAPSIENSKFLTAIFTFLGFSAAHVDGSTNSSTRAKIIQDFSSGQIQILSNYGVLATGFDAPKIDLLCIARPTKSPVLYSQMIGRGLRGPAVGGTPNCRIIEVRDNFENLGDQDQLYDSFKVYWQSE